MESKNIENLYNSVISKFYDFDSFNLLSEAREVAVGQVIKHARKAKVKRILDLGVGTGELLLTIKGSFPQAHLNGIDSSQKMLEIAQQKLDFQAFRDDFKNIRNHVNSESIDLTFMHFVLTYVDPQIIIPEIFKISQDRGLISIATSTHESLNRIQEMGRGFVDLEGFKQRTKVPQDKRDLERILQNSKFKILEIEIFEKEIWFEDFNSFYNWGMKSGWLTEFLTEFTQDDIENLSIQTRNYFPLEDKLKSVIALAQKS